MIGWLALLGGIAYGYFSPGRSDHATMLKKGLLYGIIVAIVLALLATLLNFSVLGVGGNSILANVIGAIVIVLLFVGGVWLGDWLEHRAKKPAA